MWQVSSCFSQLLNLHNLSEEISSAQLERAVRIGEVGLAAKASFSFKMLLAAIYRFQAADMQI